ncbi:hypothetical protein BCJMU51_2488 [Bacillus cereus]|nr:hypothetical protein BCM0045_2496 [Bacillus cereus]BCC00424.1 hypothetical protein BCM0057_2506 [Bacillus cereus]BCC23929.1 hypothetical protein BCM0079_2522 [Bacillus cereus]BCC35526.1 hypothetical protein BCM0105_2516 [Bacillus cereus]BCC41298.1 hypothetical protein BCJMU01_2465 [Bacillus cereus]
MKALKDQLCEWKKQSNQTKNYMLFTVRPLLKKLSDEANVKFFEMSEYLLG